MRKLLNLLIVLLILADIFLCLYKVPPIDRFISEKILNGSDTAESFSPILHSDRKKEQPSYPEIRVAEGTVYIMYGGQPVNILPEGFSVDSEEPEKVYENLFDNGSIDFSDDGKKVSFMLTFNKNSVLFLCDLEEKTSVKIDEKVDSFAMAPDGSYVFYATGYLYSNTLFLYKDGESSYICENVSALYLSDYDSVAIKAGDGTLGIFSAAVPVLKTIDKGVEKIYCPGPDNSFNYTRAYDTLSVFYEKNNSLYLFSADVNETGIPEKGVISEYTVAFEDLAPYYSFSSRYGIYKFYESRKILTEDGAAGEEVLLNNVSHVFLFDGNTKFVLAAENKLILFDAADGSSVTLMDLGRRYEGSDEMIKEKITITTRDFRVFFVCSLNDSSWIWNRYNLNSWINNISKFSFSLTKITAENGSASVSVENVPPSSSIYSGISIDNSLYFKVETDKNGETTVFYYDGTSIKEKTQSTNEKIEQ